MSAMDFTVESGLMAGLAWAGSKRKRIHPLAGEAWAWAGSQPPTVWTTLSVVTTMNLGPLAVHRLPSRRSKPNTLRLMPPTLWKIAPARALLDAPALLDNSRPWLVGSVRSASGTPAP